jgi:hypothetical protein
VEQNLKPRDDGLPLVAITNYLRGLNLRANCTDTASLLSAKLVPTFAAGGCRVASAADPYGRNVGFPDRSRYFLFQIAPELYSRG